MSMENTKALAHGSFEQSFWLTEAAKRMLDRDPLDALADAEALVAALKADVDELLRAADASPDEPSEAMIAAGCAAMTEVAGRSMGSSIRREIVVAIYRAMTEL